MPTVIKSLSCRSLPRKAAVLAAAGLALSIYSRALAQTDVNWLSATSGNWTDPTRWSNPTYPNNGTPLGSTYRVFIEAVGPAYTVTLNTSVALDYLRLNSASATLVLSSGTLTVPTFDLLAGTLRIDGGTLAGSTINIGSGGLTFSGNASNTLSGVTINGSFAGTPSFLGYTRVQNGLTLNGTATFSHNMTLELVGNQTITGEYIFQSTGTQTYAFDLHADDTTTFGAGSAIRGAATIGARPPNTSGLGHVINNGLISANTSGQSMAILVQDFTNNGTLEAINGGLLTLNNLVGNANTIRASGTGSTLTLAGTYTLNAPVNITSGGTLNLNGAWTNAAGITASGASTMVNLGGSSTAATLGAINLSAGARIGLIGTYTNTGQTLSFDATNPGWILNGGMIVGGTIATSGSEALLAKSGTLRGITNTGTITVGNSAGPVTFDGAWSNSGLINFGTSSRIVQLGGTFTTAGMGTIASNGLIRLTGALDNHGQTLNITAPGPIWTAHGGSISGGTVNSGVTTALAIDGGSTLTLNDVTLQGSMITGANQGVLTANNLINQGAITLNSPMVLQGAWSNPGSIVLNGANCNLTLGGTFNNAQMSNIHWLGGVLKISGAFDNTGGTFSSDNWGQFQIDGGTITGGAITGSGTADRFIVNANSPSALSGVLVNGSFTAYNSNGAVQTSLSLHNGTIVSGNVRSQISTLDVDATSAVNGTISLVEDSVAHFAGTRTLATSFFFESNTTATTGISLDPGATVTLGSGTLINGFRGRVGFRTGTGPADALINQGTISADTSGGTITVGADSFTNNGIIQASNGGALVVTNLQGNLNEAHLTGAASQLTIGGTYTINTPLTINGGTLTLNGAWSNAAGINATNATINLGGSLLASGIGTITRGGTTLVNLSGNLNNTGQTLAITSPLNNFGLAGGTISGGIVSTANGERLTQRSGNSSLLGLTVHGDTTVAGGTLAADAATVFNGNVAIGAGTLQFPSALTIASGDFSFTDTSYGTLQIAPSSSPATLTLGPGAIVQGGFGMLVPAGGVTNPTSLINQGMISADVSGRTLNVPANSFQNQGTIQAINGGLLSIAHMSGPVGTALADGAGSQLTLSGTYVNNGSISATNGGLIMLNGSWTNSGVINLDHGTIALSGTVTPAVFTGINNNAGSLRVLGTLLAHGLTFSVPSGSGLDIYGSSAILDASTLVVPAGETLHATQGSLRQGLVTGGGTVTMSDGVISGVLGGIGPLGAVTINSTMTITGSGQINGTTLTNNGLISADVPGHSLTTQASSFTNAGTINILNGAVFGFGDSTVWNNTGTININSGTLSLGGFFTTAGIGTINNTAGTQMQLYGHWDNTGNTLTLPQMQYFSAGEVMGGTLQIPASVNTSGARFDNVTIAGDFNPAGVTILNGLTFSGTAAFPATGGALVFSGAQTVPAGHFTLTSGPNFTSSISGGTLTLGPGVLIEGGRGMLAGSVSLNNQGVIRSNLPGEDIAIAGGNVFNTGTIEAVNGGTLTISNYNQLNAPGDTGLLRVGPGSTLLMQGSYVLAGANLLNDGGTLNLSGTVNNALSTFNLAGSALLTGRISGGTVNVTGGALTFPDGFNSGGTLDGVALNGNVEVNGNNNGTFGRLLTLRNGLTLNGTIHVTGPAAAVIFDNSETYDGGDIFFDSTSPGLRIISATNAGTLVTFGPNATVHGGAVNILDSLYVPNTSLVNHGHIAADVAGQTLSVRPHSFVNDGLMEALNGGTLNIGGVNDPGGFGATNTWSSTGVIRALPGSTLDLHGRFNTASFLSVQDAGGDVNISGVMNNAGATLSLSGAGASPRLMGGTIQGGSVVVSGTGALQVPLGGSGTLDGVSLAGDMSINGEMDLLNGTSFTGNIRIGDSGKLLVGAVNAAQPYTLSSGTVQFDGAAASILTIPTFGSDNMILGPNFLVHGGAGLMTRNGGGWTLVNYGTINADSPGNRIQIVQVDNYGTLEATNGGILTVAATLEPSTTLRADHATFELVGGSSTFISSMIRSSATVNLGGVIDNSGNTLTMDASTQWGLLGGLHLKGGSVVVAPGANVVFGAGTNFAGPITLENLNFTGDLTTTPGLLEVDIRNLVLNGNIALRTPTSKVVFVGDQTFSSGTIFFDPSGGPGQRELTPAGLGANGQGFATITFGPAGTLHGGDGLIRLGWGAGALGTLINQGLVSADITGQEIQIEQQRFVNQGTVQAINGGIITFEGPPPLSGHDPMILLNSGTVFADAHSSLLLDALECESTSVLRLEIQNAAAFGQISANSMSLDGVFAIAFAPGFVPAPGETFPLFASGDISGQFAQLDLPSLPAGYSWDLSNLYSSGNVRVVPAPGVLVALGGFFVLRRRRRS